MSDPADLTGGGTEHTLTYDGSLNGFNGSQPYYVANFDAYDQVSETTKADNVSAPLSGVFQTSDGSLYVLAGQTSGNTLSFSENDSGDVTLDGSSQTFPSAGTIYVATGDGDEHDHHRSRASATTS